MFSCRGHIFQLNEATHNFTELTTPGKAGAFQNISDKNRDIKVWQLFDVQY